MPLSGTLDLTARLADAPVMDSADADAWEIEGVELLNLSFEIDDRHMVDVLPPALHPVIPPTAYFTIARYPESPVGAFTLAQVRVGCRAAALPRGFLLRAYADTQDACDALRARWGYDCRRADVRLRTFHDRVVGSVSDGGREILRASLLNPEPISGGDVQYVANMNLAKLEGAPTLVQVDPEYRFQRADRGRPHLETFERAAWAAEDVDPVYPITATSVLCDTGFPKIRYVIDPLKPALVGTRKIADREK
ncbi:MAG TPA: acetoacetate decarboxylase family protein [Vicinamibacterales bacterium]|nr:acetoacetate decarboxylase family protein [Vicinamibacterales bacterium]